MAIVDPAQIQKEILANINKKASGEVVLANYNTPISNLTEATSATVANAINHINVLHGRRFINNATTKEDLYPHLSDKYLKFAFANPATGNFTFFFDLNYLRFNAVAVEGTTYKKIMIPKNTIVTIEGIEFIIPNAINFILLSNNSIRLEYDLRDVSDLVIVNQNTIAWETAVYEEVEIFKFTIPLLQLKRRMFEAKASPGRAYKETFEIADQFHHCNVYTYINGTRKKLETTLSQEVKDINKATAIVTVLEKAVNVEIPLIYFNKGLVGNDVEIELFVTKGSMSMDMADFTVSSFSLTYGDEFYTASDGKYFNPLARISAMGLYSDDVVTGGTNSPTFAELKKYVVYGVDKTEAPINQNQLRNVFERNGFSFTVEKDRLLERIFVASKDLPSDETNEFNTGMSCGITRVTVTAQTLSNSIDTISDNDKRVTLLPGTLFDVSTKPYVIPKHELPTTVTSNNVDLANLVNTKNYVFNPFHYVIDMSDDRLDLRPYHLDPKLTGRQAIAINDASQFSLSTLTTTITLEETGFVLFLEVSMSDNIDHSRLFSQLSFVPVDDFVKVYLEGELVSVEDGIAVFKFNFNSSFDIDLYNSIYFSNFKEFSGDTISVKSQLTSSFDLVYGLTNSSTYVSSNIDNMLNPNLIEGLPTSITHERLTFEFGTFLKNLWSKSKNVNSSLEYDYYEEDVPYYFTETIPERNEGRIVFEETSDGMVPKIKHHKGDPLVIDGEVQYRYRAGTVKRDPVTMNPLFKSPGRTTQRNLHIFTMDANYLYSSAPTDTNYKDFLIDTVVSICNDDIESMVPDQGENTEILFYPTNSVGTVDVIGNNSENISLDSNVSFEVTVYLTSEAFSNDVLRKSLSTGIKKIIASNLEKRTVAIALIEKEIKESFETDIISVTVSPDFSDEEIDIITTVESSSKLTIRRRLSLLEDNSLYVEDGVTISYKVHEQ